MKVVITLKLLIIRCTAERRDMFYIYCSVINLDIKFVHEVCLSHEFDKFEGHQQPDFIKKVLNKDCFEGFIIKIVMLDDDAQELSIVFLKMVILLLAGLQFKLGFHD